MSHNERHSIEKQPYQKQLYKSISVPTFFEFNNRLNLSSSFYCRRLDFFAPPILVRLDITVTSSG